MPDYGNKDFYAQSYLNILIVGPHRLNKLELKTLRSLYQYLDEMKASLLILADKSRNPDLIYSSIFTAYTFLLLQIIVLILMNIKHVQNSDGTVQTVRKWTLFVLLLKKEANP